VTPLTIARLALLLIGVALFAYSMRSGEGWARMAAIGVLVVAIIIRFLDRRRGAR
jgi:hypothetical protein